jgi:hypothetical protein
LRRLALIVAGAAALTGAAPALAADHSGTLSVSARTFKWDSAAAPAADPLALAGCPDPRVTCETTLIHVADTGGLPQQLVVSVTSDDTLAHTDLTLYASNAEGARFDELGTTSTIGQVPAGHVITEARKGYYLAVTTHRFGYGAAHGTAELLGEGQEFAAAAPAKRATLSAAKTQYKWAGIGGNGAVFDCGEIAPQVQPCDFVLVHITEPGDLTATLSDAAPTTADNYLKIYASDKAGSKSDETELATNLDPLNSNKSVGAAGLAPGYYLVQVGWLAAVNGTYNGTIDFTPTPPDEGAEELS